MFSEQGSWRSGRPLFLVGQFANLPGTSSSAWHLGRGPQFSPQKSVVGTEDPAGLQGTGASPGFFRAHAGISGPDFTGSYGALQLTALVANLFPWGFPRGHPPSRLCLGCCHPPSPGAAVPVFAVFFVIPRKFSFAIRHTDWLRVLPSAIPRAEWGGWNHWRGKPQCFFLYWEPH